MDSLSHKNSAFTSLQDFINATKKVIEKKQTLIKDLAKKGKLNLPQTNAHLLFSFNRIGKLQGKKKISDYLQNRNSLYFASLSDALKKEQEACNNNHFVLYHSTKAQYYASHYIDTQLLLLTQELIYQHRIPTQNILKLRQGISSIPDNEHANKRLHFIMNGTPNDHFNKEFLLSCNAALTGNIDDIGECTLNFWLNSTNVNYVHISMDDIISGYTHFNITKKQIVTLKKAIEAPSFKTGILLQLIFKSPALVNSCVYSSKPYGIKHNVHITTKKHTDNVVDILNALRHNPAKIKDEIDGLQFRVVLTQDKLLDITNPEIYNNFEIYAYCAPQSALETFHMTVQEVIQEIKESYIKTCKA